eukprot:g5828.t1
MGDGWEVAGGQKGKALANKSSKQRRKRGKKGAAEDAEEKKQAVLAKLPHWYRQAAEETAANSKNHGGVAEDAGWQTVGKGGEVKLNSKQRRQLARREKQDAFRREQQEQELLLDESRRQEAARFATAPPGPGTAPLLTPSQVMKAPVAAAPSPAPGQQQVFLLYAIIAVLGSLLAWQLWMTSSSNK